MNPNSQKSALAGMHVDLGECTKIAHEDFSYNWQIFITN
jgi:hypothetical protein